MMIPKMHYKRITTLISIVSCFLLMSSGWLSMTALAACGGVPTFSAAVHHVIGEQPQAIATADFNNDGLPDMAVANFDDFSSSGISVLMNNGNGTFTTNSFSAGGRPVSIAAGDVTNDGKPDIVVSNVLSNQIVYFPGNGDGTFSGPVFISYSLPYTLVLADVNNDSRLDLVVAGISIGGFSVFLQQPAGGFNSLPDFNDGGIVSGPRGLAVGKFDGDNNLDIAITGNSIGFVIKGNGDGTFGATLQVLTPALHDLGFSIPQILATDFDLDGITDLLIANQDLGSVSALHNDGAGNFTRMPFSPINLSGDAVNSLAVGDLDGDGKPDLITANSISDNFAIFLNATVVPGTGAIGPILLNPLSKPYAVAAADFLGTGSGPDGRVDLAFGRGDFDNIAGTLTILPNACANTADLSIVKTHVDPFTFGSPGSYTLTVTNNGISPASTTGRVYVSDSLPVASLSFVSTAGTDPIWTCSFSSPLVSCYTDTVFKFGDTSAIQINVGVVTATPSSATNVAALAAPGDAILAGNNVSFDLTNILKLTPTFSNLSVTPPNIIFGQTPVTASGKIASGVFFPSGSVNITINGVTQPAAINPLDGTFSSVFATNLFSATPGTYPVTFNYAGDNNFNGANDSSLSLTVGFATTATALISSVNPQVFGLPVTFTANVSILTGAGIPTGTVTFKDGITPIGTIPINGLGVATLTTSSLTVGAHPITATYSGDANFNFSFSSSLNQVINPAVCVTPPSGMVSWHPGQGNANDIFGTNNGTLINGAGFAAGMVGQAFSLNGIDQYVNVPNAASLNFGTNQNFSIDAWIRVDSGSPKSIIAIVDKRQISPDVIGYALFLFNGKLSAQLGQVGLAPDYENFIPGLGPDLRDGQFHHVALSVNRTSATGGKLYVDGVAIATFNPTAQAGNLTNTADLRIGGHADTPAFHFPGRIDEVEIFNQALSPVDITSLYQASVAGKCQVTDLSLAKSHNPTPFTVSQPGTYTLAVTNVGTIRTFSTITVTDTLPSGMNFVNNAGSDPGWSCGAVGPLVTCTNSNTLLVGQTSNVKLNVTVAEAGSKTNTAAVSIAGDANTSNNSANDTQTVNKGIPTVALVSSVNPSVFQQSVTFTVTVSPQTPGVGQPTGTATFKDGATTLAIVPLNGVGVAAFSTSALSVGAHPITVDYSGDANFIAGTSNTVIQVVNKANTALVLTTSANPANPGGVITFTATISVLAPGSGSPIAPTGTVTFKEGATTLAVRPVVGGTTATFSTALLGAGSHNITAIYSGDGNFNGSTSNTLVQIIGRADLHISQSTGQDPVMVGETLHYEIRVASGGPNNAFNVVMHDVTPVGTFFAGISTDTGSCTTPAIGMPGAITCNLGNFVPGENHLVQLYLFVDTLNSSITHTASVTTDSIDPDLNNNTTTRTIQVTQISALSMPSIPVTTKTVTIMVNGTNFPTGSIVQVNGVNRQTQYVSSSKLTVTLSSNDTSKAGKLMLRVKTPTGQITNAKAIQVSRPLTKITRDSSGASTSGSAAGTTSNGPEQAIPQPSGTSVNQGGQSSPSRIPAPVFVDSPNATARTEKPASISLSVTSLSQGSKTVTVEVSGSSFEEGSVVQINGEDRPTEFVSGGKLKVTLSEGDTETVGSLTVKVVSAEGKASGAGTIKVKATESKKSPN